MPSKSLNQALTALQVSAAWFFTSTQHTPALPPLPLHFSPKSGLELSVIIAPAGPCYSTRWAPPESSNKSGSTLSCSNLSPAAHLPPPSLPTCSLDSPVLSQSPFCPLFHPQRMHFTVIPPCGHSPKPPPDLGLLLAPLPKWIPTLSSSALYGNLQSRWILPHCLICHC